MPLVGDAFSLIGRLCTIGAAREVVTFREDVCLNEAIFHGTVRPRPPRLPKCKSSVGTKVATPPALSYIYLSLCKIWIHVHSCDD